MNKRFLALLLTLAMILGCLTGCEDTPEQPTETTAPARPSIYRWYEDDGTGHATASLADMPYEIYDIQTFYDLVDELDDLAQKPGNEAAITECYNKLITESTRISTTYALAYLRYMAYLTTDYADDMTTMEDISTEASDALYQKLGKLLESDYADLTRQLLGDDEELETEI